MHVCHRRTDEQYSENFALASLRCCMVQWLTVYNCAEATHRTVQHYSYISISICSRSLGILQNGETFFECPEMIPGAQQMWQSRWLAWPERAKSMLLYRWSKPIQLTTRIHKHTSRPLTSIANGCSACLVGIVAVAAAACHMDRMTEDIWFGQPAWTIDLASSIHTIHVFKCAAYARSQEHGTTHTHTSHNRRTATNIICVVMWNIYLCRSFHPFCFLICSSSHVRLRKC